MHATMTSCGNFAAMTSRSKPSKQVMRKAESGNGLTTTITVFPVFPHPDDRVRIDPGVNRRQVGKDFSKWMRLRSVAPLLCAWIRWRATAKSSRSC